MKTFLPQVFTVNPREILNKWRSHFIVTSEGPGDKKCCGSVCVSQSLLLTALAMAKFTSAGGALCESGKWRNVERSPAYFLGYSYTVSTAQTAILA